MTDRTCSVDGCSNLVRARGWCAKHYERWRAHGDPGKTLLLPDRERILAKVPFGDSEDCWEWPASRMRSGYGRVFFRGKMALAHRAVYVLLVGPIPDGLQIDHLCRNPPCVNPAHLEPVTQRENMLRGVSPAAQQARRTHCPQGHPYDEGNTYMHRGHRTCKACAAERMRRVRANDGPQ